MTKIAQTLLIVKIFCVPMLNIHVGFSAALSIFKAFASFVQTLSVPWHQCQKNSHVLASVHFKWYCELVVRQRGSTQIRWFDSKILTPTLPHPCCSSISQLGKMRLLDVGSCFNPFLKFDEFLTVGIDIVPAVEVRVLFLKPSSILMFYIELLLPWSEAWGFSCLVVWF